MLQLPLNISIKRLMDSFLCFLINQVFPYLEMEFGMSGMLTYNFTESLFLVQLTGLDSMYSIFECLVEVIEWELASKKVLIKSQFLCFMFYIC